MTDHIPLDAMTTEPTTPAPAEWIDGHPQLEAIAATVWERCRTEGTSLVVDDPRNIAVAALAALPAPSAPTGDQAALRERIADVLADADGQRWAPGYDYRALSPAYQRYLGWADKVIAVLPTTGDRAASPLRDDALRALDFPLCQTLGYTTPEGLLAAYDTTMRAAVLREAADFAEDVAESLRKHHEFERSTGALDVMTELRRLAAGAQQQPERCVHCTHPKRDHDGRADHREKFSPLVAGQPWCHACNAACDYAGAQQQPTTETPTPAEDPARIDRLRPEFTEHASIEAIDAQLQRARAQQRRWHLRAEWLVSLRADRVAQKERGEWPAGGAQQDGEQRCPAKHGALGRICELPAGHQGMHTGSGPNGGAVWDGDAS